ncbi:hypothetical protein [Borreliella burgdorferi]|uniref:hypothetical protein n=1 Tax=Borreliella burgdorferi TaxID=139 RepID=UPI003AB3C56C
MKKNQKNKCSEIEKTQLEIINNQSEIEKQLHQLEIEFTGICLLYVAIHYLNLELNNYSQKNS